MARQNFFFFGPLLKKYAHHCVKIFRRVFPPLIITDDSILTQLDKITVENIQIDQVRSFRCLNTIVNGNNILKEEIRERIVKGKKEFYVNRALFESKLVSIKCKLKVYWSVIRPVVVYGCETWGLKESTVKPA